MYLAMYLTIYLATYLAMYLVMYLATYLENTSFKEITSPRQKNPYGLAAIDFNKGSLNIVIYWN